MKSPFDRLVQEINKEKEKKIKREALGDNEQEPNLLNISKKLDELYFQEKLIIYCNYLSYSGMMSDEALPYRASEFHLIKETLFYLYQNDYDNRVIQIYWKIKTLFERVLSTKYGSQQDQLLKDCIKLIEQHQAIFRPVDLLEMYSFLTNYTIRRLNQGYRSYVPNILQLYNQLLVIKYHQIKRNRQSLHSNAFRNIVSLCILQEDTNFYNELMPSSIEAIDKAKGFKNNLEWGQQFIEKFKYFLPKKHQDKYYRYCKALILFKAKDYLKAFKAIGNIKGLRGLYIGLDLKLLYLQIIYEINEMEGGRKKMKALGLDTFDEIDKKINAYRSIIWQEDKSNPKLAYQKKYFSSFLDLYQKLYQFYCKYNFVFVGSKQNYLNSKRNLEKLIQDCPFTYKKWMREKLDKITKDKPLSNK